MTEEDLNLIACAALHGARFREPDEFRMWRMPDNDIPGGFYTQARAACYYLHYAGLIDEAEWIIYRARTSEAGQSELREFRASRMLATN